MHFWRRFARHGSRNEHRAPMQGTLASVTPTNAAVSIRYAVKPSPEAWVLPEGTVPEAVFHNEAARELELVLLEWAKRTSRSVAIGRNLAIRWLQHAPKTGIDPDVCVLEPAPPNFANLKSLPLWEPGNIAPPLSIEIVSTNHPHKDYVDIQNRYAAFGAFELAVFDPELAGPSSLGGPVLLQLWRRDVTGLFERVHFEDGAAYSKALGAWLVPDGRHLAIADDPAGKRRWLNGEGRERLERERAVTERERAEAERERAEAERERAEAEREELKRRVLELERRIGEGGPAR
jgi:hypothetical protein